MTAGSVNDYQICSQDSLIVTQDRSLASWNLLPPFFPLYAIYNEINRNSKAMSYHIFKYLAIHTIKDRNNHLTLGMTNNFNSLVTDEVEHHFICLLTSWTSLFMKVTVKSATSFSTEFLVSFFTYLQEVSFFLFEWSGIKFFMLIFSPLLGGIFSFH